jgi:periplasmic divalent cation tolerance protein
MGSTMTDDTAVLLLTTVGSPEDAARIGRVLVEARLAACVSVLPVRSTYRWRGAVVEEGEQMMLIKAPPGGVDRIRERLLAEHPYEVPELLVVDASGVPEPYRRWLDESTA